MARGGRRTGAGRPALPVGDHLKRGTFRRDRHGDPPVTGTLAVMPPSTAGWRPSNPAMAALTAPGRAFLASLVADFDFTAIEGQLVLEAAHALDRLTALRTMNRTGVTPKELAAIERLDMGWVKILGGLLAQLKVTP